MSKTILVEFKRQRGGKSIFQITPTIYSNTKFICVSQTNTVLGTPRLTAHWCIGTGEPIRVIGSVHKATVIPIIERELCKAAVQSILKNETRAKIILQ